MNFYQLKVASFVVLFHGFNLQLQGKLYKPMHINLGPTLTNFPALDVSDSLQEPHLKLHELDKSFTNVIQPHS